MIASVSFLSFASFFSSLFAIDSLLLEPWRRRAFILFFFEMVLLITFNNNYTIYTIYIHDYMIFM